MLPEGIEQIPLGKWENKHQNFTQKIEKNACFKLRNPASINNNLGKYQASTKNFQWLIQYALDHNYKMRALGSGWSFSKVAVTDGGLIDNKSLTLSFRLEAQNLSPEYLAKGKSPQDLLFMQCGIAIEALNDTLENKLNPKRALKASGASNGQTIAGAMSTGTHGAAFGVGAIQDFVVGLHVVVGADRHVYIERASYPVVSDGFIRALDAEVIRDDTVFNAVLVSFGSFGFIHGVMIESEPIYLLSEKRVTVKFDQHLKDAMNTLDFNLILDKLPFPPFDPQQKLYHFEVVINPHKFALDSPDNEVYLKTLYKVPYFDGYPKRLRPDHKYTYGDDVLGLVQFILDGLPILSPVLIPPLVNTLFPLAFSGEDIPGYGTVGETFTYTRFRGKVASAALGLDIKDAYTVLEQIIKVNEDKSFAGGLSFRFVKGTQALLGFTRFPQTCVLEMDGVDAKVTRDFYQKLWDKLEELNIHYTLHWGKFNFNLDKARIRRMYGDQAVDEWVGVRNMLLSKETRQVFHNDFIEKCGLTEDLPPFVLPGVQPV